MELKEKQIRSEEVFKCKVFTVRKDDVLLPDGTVTERDVVNHLGGVCIAAKKTDGTFIVVNQYRYALNQELTEFVAGKKEKGEDPLETAKRELIEESGYEAANFECFGKFIPTCGYDNEVIDLYYADDLTYVGQNLDSNEFLNVSSMTLDDIMEKIHNGEITDGKTIILAYKLKEADK